MRLRRSAFLTGAAALAALPPLPLRAENQDSALKPAAVANQVRAEFLHAWNGYKRFAWGRDEVAPVSGKPKDFFIDGH